MCYCAKTAIPKTNSIAHHYNRPIATSPHHHINALASNLTKSLGTTLREAREAAGLSLRALSKLSGMSPGEISQIECGGRKSPGFPSIARIARSLNLSLDELACSSGLIEDANLALPRTENRNRAAALGELRKIKSDVSDGVDRVLEMLVHQAPSNGHKFQKRPA